MQYSEPLIAARLVRRYKRFLADVRLADGSELTVHCPNTGSMLRCMPDNGKIWLSKSNNPKRKYQYTWEWVLVDDQYKTCINPSLANRLIAEGLTNGVIPGLAAEDILRSEPKVEDGRLDFHIQRADVTDEYIEVKSVTLKPSADDSIGAFPDAKTDRGLKHLKRLASFIKQGYQARLIFCVMHQGIDRVTTADDIDPAYAQALRQVTEQGVVVEAYRASFFHDQQQSKLQITENIPVII